MPKSKEPASIESTAGEVAAELARRGIAADQHLTITIEPRGAKRGAASARMRLVVDTSVFVSAALKQSSWPAPSCAGWQIMAA